MNEDTHWHGRRRAGCGSGAGRSPLASSSRRVRAASQAATIIADVTSLPT